jgi:peroxidase
MFTSWSRLRMKVKSLVEGRKATRAVPCRRSLPRLTVEPLEERSLLSADGMDVILGNVGQVQQGMSVIGFRSIDGTGNNLANPEWGSTGEQLLRVAPAAYTDGISAPAGAERPSAREISNAVIAHDEEATPNDRNLSAYIYVWGQFLDHDIDRTGTALPLEPFNVAVPAGDPTFDPDGTGTQVIPLNRSVYDPLTGTSTSNPRQQINEVTSWLDGSQIYGPDAATAASLRTFEGGKLKTSPGDLLPTDAAGNFLAGDVRANENIELSSMQTLFVREHNRLADQIAAANPGLSDEEIYQRARALVIAELQVITYNEWLPALLGPNALSPYQGYDPTVNPDIANEFSTAAFRLHTTINDDVEFFDNDGRPISFTYVNAQGETVTVEGEVPLFEAFNNPALLQQSGVDGLLKYAASTHMEELDTQVVDSLRDFLFVQVAGGLDLASLNIQRGRDHGLADYNTVREAYGLPRVESFAEITSDPELQQQLEDLYGSVDNIDLWVGGLAEDHVPGSSTGPTIRAILIDQFERLRDGDRFWYQRVFSGAQLAQLERTTLADIIERNTGVVGLQDNVFFFKAQVQGQVFFDRNGDGELNRRETPLRGVSVELLNDEGEIIATTMTDRSGRYRFDQFGETGDFQVRVVLPSTLTATTANPREFLVSTGDEVARGVDLGIRLANRTTAGSDSQELAGVLAALGLDDLGSGGFGHAPHRPRRH